MKRTGLCLFLSAFLLLLTMMFVGYLHAEAIELPPPMMLPYIAADAPALHMPQTLYILEGRDLVIERHPEIIILNAGGTEYIFPLHGERVADFVPAGSPWPTVAGLVVAALAAVIADETLPMPPVQKQMMAAGIGAVSGGLTIVILGR